MLQVQFNKDEIEEKSTKKWYIVYYFLITITLTAISYNLQTLFYNSTT